MDYPYQTFCPKPSKLVYDAGLVMECCFPFPSCDSRFDSEDARTKRRQYPDEHFRRFFSRSLKDGCTDSMARKTCIWGRGCCSATWLDIPFGMMWVAVQGKNSICLVTRNEDLDMTRVGGLFEHVTEGEVPHCLRETLISEIKELADESLQRFGQSIDKPFGVVSVIPRHVESGHEASGAENGEKMAIKFLREKLGSSLAFSTGETIQIAISAFQHLFLRKFKADDISVTVWRDNESICHLDVCDVEEHLAKLDCGGIFNHYGKQRRQKNVTDEGTTVDQAGSEAPSEAHVQPSNVSDAGGSKYKGVAYKRPRKRQKIAEVENVQVEEPTLEVDVASQTEVALVDDVESSMIEDLSDIASQTEEPVEVEVVLSVGATTEVAEGVRATCEASGSAGARTEAAEGVRAIGEASGSAGATTEAADH